MTFPDGTPEDMDRAVASARAAFDTGPWPRMSPQERGEMLLKVAAVLSGVPELADAWTAQVGAPISLTKYASTQAPGLFEFYGKMIQTYPLVDERKRDDGKRRSRRPRTGRRGCGDHTLECADGIAVLQGRSCSRRRLHGRLETCAGNADGCVSPRRVH